MHAHVLACRWDRSDGVIVSIKDVFDVAGEPTRAGSKALVDASPATADAEVVRRVRAGGGIIIAKTNMTEFAFSTVGTNLHYGTPGNPADRTRVPGGSSSGGAVAVADGMCEIAIGTDSGGSTRVPAAFCGIVGFKPSKSRVPTEGASRQRVCHDRSSTSSPMPSTGHSTTTMCGGALSISAATFRPRRTRRVGEERNCALDADY